MPACSILPLVHHHHEVGERERLVLAVGDVDEGNAEPPLQPPQLGAHAHAQERVERRQRLVEQQDLRMGDERARQRDALLLAAGELGGDALGEGRHGDELEKLHRLLAPLRLVDAAHLQREGDVVDAIEMREQRVALEHHRRAALGRRQVGDVGVADQDVAFADRLVAGDHPQGRGLAAARGAEQTAIAVGGHAQVDRVDRERRAVALADADEFEIGGLGHGARVTGYNASTRQQGPCHAAPHRRALIYKGLFAEPGEAAPKPWAPDVYNIGDLVYKIR